MKGCSQSGCGWASTEATYRRPLRSCGRGSQACSMLLLGCGDPRLNCTQGFYAMAFPLHQAHSPWSMSKVYGIGVAVHWMPLRPCLCSSWACCLVITFCCDAFLNGTHGLDSVKCGSTANALATLQQTMGQCATGALRLQSMVLPMHHAVAPCNRLLSVIEYRPC